MGKEQRVVDGTISTSPTRLAKVLEFNYLLCTCIQTSSPSCGRAGRYSTVDELVEGTSSILHVYDEDTLRRV